MIPIIDLCSEGLCMATATQIARPPGLPGHRLALCDMHAQEFIAKAGKRGIGLAELGLSPIARVASTSSTGGGWGAE